MICGRCGCQVPFDRLVQKQVNHDGIVAVIHECPYCFPVK